MGHHINLNNGENDSAQCAVNGCVYFPLFYNRRWFDVVLFSFWLCRSVCVYSCNCLYSILSRLKNVSYYVQNGFVTGFICLAWTLCENEAILCHHAKSKHFPTMLLKLNCRLYNKMSPWEFAPTFTTKQFLKLSSYTWDQCQQIIRIWDIFSSSLIFCSVARSHRFLTLFNLVTSNDTIPYCYTSHMKKINKRK